MLPSNFPNFYGGNFAWKQELFRGKILEDKQTSRIFCVRLLVLFFVPRLITSKSLITSFSLYWTLNQWGDLWMFQRKQDTLLLWNEKLLHGKITPWILKLSFQKRNLPINNTFRIIVDRSKFKHCNKYMLEFSLSWFYGQFSVSIFVLRHLSCRSCDYNLSFFRLRLPIQEVTDFNDNYVTGFSVECLLVIWLVQ